MPPVYITEENKNAYVAALVREKAHYETSGNADAVKEVDAELARWRSKSEAPQQRAQKRA